jgi:cellulose synthase/poly-beta-1,6-N-acetylglucosamine synthase-like glycosyltransferase
MLDHSVLVYSHNQGPFIQACVESLLTQSVPPDEIIIYDAGSVDDTRMRLRPYGPRVRVLFGPAVVGPAHAAEAKALAHAFAASQGELIFLLDADDRFKCDKIRRYSAAFENHPDASVVQAPLDRIDRDGGFAGSVVEPRYHVSNHLREIYQRHDLNFFYPTSALAFARSYLERVLPLDLNDGLPLWTDVRLCIPAIYYGRIVTLPDPMTEWRVHATADAQRVRPGRPKVDQILMRTRVFNTFCRQNDLRTITPWRNAALYRHLAVCAVPPAMIDFCARLLRAGSCNPGS